MHLLATTSGELDGSPAAVDLSQSPADIIFLSAADSELSAISRVYGELAPPKPTLRLASLLQLQHNLSVDLYVDKTIRQARLVVVRLLGGTSYWRYGLEQLIETCRERGIGLAILPGDSAPDADLMARSTLDQAACERLRRYVVFGGSSNLAGFIRYCAYLLGQGQESADAVAMPPAGIYRTEKVPGTGSVGIVFYRSLLEGAQCDPIDGLIDALSRRGLSATALYVTSLKDEDSARLVSEALSSIPADLVINTTSFAVGNPGRDPLGKLGCPVLQCALAGSTEQQWKDSTRGLGPRDLAMNVVLPEIDGRIFTRAISFKDEVRRDDETQCAITTYVPSWSRIEFVGDLAANWITLGKTARSARRIAILLANYPNRDGRIANGVGYDTPASTVAILNSLQQAGYHVAQIPEDGNALIAELLMGPTNAPSSKNPTHRLRLADYRKLFDRLPGEIQSAVQGRWGNPSDDPFFADEAFRIPAQLYGNVAVVIQPARGYNINPKETYHDPALVPPHGYFAIYFWLRQEFGAQAVIHNGKHGNLEWLPGKAMALSELCYPEAVLGPLPQLYPFIVNDPGEGTQAKRRTSAVIIDHLTPPLTRAETYGALRDLEALVDEYYLASGLDQQRAAALKETILQTSRSERIDADAGLTGDSEEDLQRLDAYLCDLKEAQIRDGLHVFGSSPAGRQEIDLLVALTRVPRKLGEGQDASLIRSLAKACSLGEFDPLTCDHSVPWTGPRPRCLKQISDAPWRSAGDTVERLEILATKLIENLDQPGDSARDLAPLMQSPELQSLLNHIAGDLRPLLRSCGPRETAALLAALDGSSVSPGPSGAPTRGRLDVLPTGRNFYSLDSRSLPTPTAWNLGQRSADELLKRHFQDTGRYPSSIGLTAWGTSNMRTGGDDIAQALALIGVRPVWEPSSWRVTGFEVVPLPVLGRPRVDVTLRISGFFRDAFPAQIELLDKAMKTVGGLQDEEEALNPIAANMRRETARLVADGLPEENARHLASFRIFGSKPGTYGAGLQALIDEGIWASRSDLAAAYVTWGSYAYGDRLDGHHDPIRFKDRLRRIEAVIQNQDNREHDLLDSDDYYQFEGGMIAAVEEYTGSRPLAFHNDHSRPERPVIRSLEQEIGRVMRSRVVNPKWIAGVKRHGYKGAFEIAATVDYMFAFAATTGAVKTHHFDLAFDAFINDEATRTFIAENNPAALKEIATRFDEAVSRGLWTPRSNSAHVRLRELMT